MSKLEGLNRQVRSCRLCRLCRTRLNGVPGEGNERAEVLFIGEGPGFNEDQEGRPFVGNAGKFLDELLEIAGFARGDVYITNVVKCRPPQNRDPLPDEIDACAPYLERQIATIDPVLIVTLGRFSMNWFFPGDRISNVHGQARPVDGRLVMTMWHPAYGLRDAAGKESLKDDFRKLPAVVEQARALRTQRPAVKAAPPPDFSALIADHLPPPTTDAAVPAPPVSASQDDEFAYLAAIIPPASHRRAPVVVETLPDARAATGALHEAGPVPEYATAGATSVPAQAPVEAKVRRPRTPKPLPAVLAPEEPAGDPLPPPEAPMVADKRSKKGKTETDFQQLSLFG